MSTKVTGENIIGKLQKNKINNNTDLPGVQKVIKADQHVWGQTAGLYHTGGNLETAAVEVQGLSAAGLIRDGLLQVLCCSARDPAAGTRKHAGTKGRERLTVKRKKRWGNVKT